MGHRDAVLRNQIKRLPDYCTLPCCIHYETIPGVTLPSSVMNLPQINASSRRNSLQFVLYAQALLMLALFLAFGFSEIGYAEGPGSQPSDRPFKSRHHHGAADLWRVNHCTPAPPGQCQLSGRRPSSHRNSTPRLYLPGRSTQDRNGSDHLGVYWTGVDVLAWNIELVGKPVV
jgi:hypothetical protein